VAVSRCTRRPATVSRRPNSVFTNNALAASSSRDALNSAEAVGFDSAKGGSPTCQKTRSGRGGEVPTVAAVYRIRFYMSSPLQVGICLRVTATMGAGGLLPLSQAAGHDAVVGA
jgi:hypothetical protein